MEQQCPIYNSNSLNFFRAACGVLALVAFLFKSNWLVLATGILVSFGIFSMRFNILYQFHSLVLRKLTKEEVTPIQKESGELRFVYGFTAALFFIGFLLIYFEKFAGFGWVLVLIVSFLMLLASFADICVASLMYAFFKKIFKR